MIGHFTHLALQAFTKVHSFPSSMNLIFLTMRRSYHQKELQEFMQPDSTLI